MLHKEIINLGNNRSIGKLIFAIVVCVIVFILAFASFSIIPTGYTGVRTTFGQIDSDVITPGFTWKIPFAQSIEKINNKQQDVEYADDEIWCEASERTAVYAKNVTVSYQLNGEKSSWIYSNVEDYEDNILNDGLVASAIKSATKKFDPTNVTNRSKIEPESAKTLQQAIDEKYGSDIIIINKVTISDMDFKDEYKNAIAAKQNTQMEYETQQIKNKKSVEKAEADAKASKVKAQADADVKKIKAAAEAEANKKLANSLSDKIIQNNYINKWDGKLPQVSGSDKNIISFPAE